MCSSQSPSITCRRAASPTVFERNRDPQQTTRRAPAGAPGTRATGCLTSHCDNSDIQIHNSAAERALRGIRIVIGRRNYLFAGGDCGGKRAAAIYLLVDTRPS